MILELKDVDAGYGFLQVLRNVSLYVDKGEYVCLIGPNGAGKSTLLKTIFGIISPSNGEVVFNGNAIAGMKAHKIANSGVAYVSEEMNLFVNMTVQENLRAGAYSIKDKTKIKERVEFVYDFFPRLAERRKQLAGHMSGGERKMLAISRGLMSYPQLLLVDEPSFGLSPQVTEDVFRALQSLNNDGLTILLVEQNVVKTLAVTNRAYVLENGQMIMSGPSADLAHDEHIRKVFLGR